MPHPARIRLLLAFALVALAVVAGVRRRSLPSSDRSAVDPHFAGATRGECAEIDRTDRCVEFWEQDGFVVGVLLADRVWMDRPTASAVLAEVVPAVVTSLAGAQGPGADPLAGVTDEDIEAAAAGSGAAGWRSHRRSDPIR